MGKSYVVQGAKLKCSCGSTPSTFNVPMHHNEFIEGKAQGNVKDSRPGMNVQSFGPCANRPKRKPCDLLLGSTWIAGKIDVKVGNAPALLNTSKLRCNRGGIISVIDPGQTLDKTGAAPIRILRKNTGNIDNSNKINATWYGKADKKSGELYAIVEKGGSICGLGKAMYNSEKAGYEIAEINNINNPDKIQVGQRVKLEALKGYNNDKYFQMIIGSFLIRELSYKNVSEKGISFANFSEEDRAYLRRYTRNLKELHDNGKINENKYKSEINRLGGYIYDDAFGNVETRTIINRKDSLDVYTFDEDLNLLITVVTLKLGGASFEHKWRITPQSEAKYESGKGGSLKAKVVDIGLTAELIVFSIENTKSVGPVDLSLKVKSGFGGGCKFSIDEQGKPSFKVSGIMGFGYEIGIKVK